VNADGAGFLGDTYYQRFDVAGGHHHQVGQLVDDNDDVGHAFFLFEIVVLADVALADFGQGAVAALHLGDGPLQGADALLGLGDNRREEMRNVIIRLEFDLLGSTRMSLRSAGEFRYKRLVRIVLIMTDLPEPVWPATRMMRHFVQVGTIGVPEISLPMAKLQRPCLVLPLLR
jgi:hypothetical protein